MNAMPESRSRRFVTVDVTQSRLVVSSSSSSLPQPSLPVALGFVFIVVVVVVVVVVAAVVVAQPPLIVSSSLASSSQPSLHSCPWSRLHRRLRPRRRRRRNCRCTVASGRVVVAVVVTQSPLVASSSLSSLPSSQSSLHSRFWSYRRRRCRRCCRRYTVALGRVIVLVVVRQWTK